MQVVDQDKSEGGGQPARFSPLRMVARALTAWHGAPVEAEAPPAPMAGDPIMPTFAARATEPAGAASGDGFLAIVNAMLAMDDAAGLEPDETEFDLVALIGEAHEAFAPAAETLGVTLALAVGAGAAGVYRGDFPRLRQMLLNLLSGALKATREDTLEVTAAWDAGVLTLHVAGADLATAMARVTADKARPGARRQPAHGLALARTSALALGGTVRATPADGVEIMLPLRRLADAHPTAAIDEPVAEAAPPAPVFAPGLRVLVAEDSAAHQQVLTTLLAGMGLEAVVVRDGQEVVAAWREQGWDALLIDIEGEAICGRSVARSIRTAEAKARWPRMPMLALAANMKLGDLDEDFAAVIDGLVAKPIHAASLYAAIETALNAERAAPAATPAAGFRTQA